MLLLACTPLLACTQHAVPVTRVVTISGMQFQPASLNAHVGDTIVFRNSDMVPHTATSAGVFDLTNIEVGTEQHWVATSAGTYAYMCSYHPTMKGTIEVQ